MKRLASAVLAVAALAAAIPAAAQQQPSHNGAGNPINSRSVVPTDVGLRGQYESWVDGSTGNNLAAQPLARVDLANRVSTLVELGRCGEARALANEAGDRQMALRARQLCRADRTGA